MVTSRSRRRLSPEARRGELIDAAIRLLRSGQEVTNWVQAVTTEADAAKGTFYVYFSSWEDMLAAVRDHVQRDYVDRFHRLAESTEPIDWWATLDAECAAAIEDISRPGGLHAAVFHSAPEPTGGGGSTSSTPSPRRCDAAWTTARSAASTRTWRPRSCSRCCTRPRTRSPPAISGRAGWRPYATSPASGCHRRNHDDRQAGRQRIGMATMPFAFRVDRTKRWKLGLSTWLSRKAGALPGSRT
ncbi:TetR/AcrR family transcriptional regulator [Nonomuraea rubra]|uniref:TetR/AcrR family transcriptional regulator n=1 Tax=Nonomuraea rubra TaxID=46180 RepID=UPI00360B7E71